MRRLFRVETVVFLFLSSGCSGPNTGITAKNIETAAAIDSAFVPGAAIIGAPPAVVDVVKYFAKMVKPTLTKLSPNLDEILKKSPRLVMDETYTKVVKWLPSAYIDGGKRIRVTFDTAPQINLDYQIVHTVAGHRFRSGDFGDGGPDVVKKNLEAWHDGKLVVSEYNGPNGVKVVVVSDNNKPAEMMLPEEWEKRKSQYGLTPAKPVLPVEEKAKEGTPP
jgi:hypothetical protein